MTTVNLTSINLAGDGPGVVQNYDYGDQAGLNFTLTMRVIGSPDAGNPGGPALTGNNVGGRTEYSTGNGPGVSSGVRVNRVVLESNRPLDSIDWGVFGMSGAPGEYISFISHNGSSSGMGAGSLGTVAFDNLGGATEVYFEYGSESSGNNTVFGPIGDAVLTVSGGGGQTYIQPGEIKIVGTPTWPGVYAAVVSVSDSNGYVGAVPIRFEVETGAGPVMTALANQAGLAGTVIALPVVATSPQGLDLTFEAENLPPGLSIDPDTGVIGGTLDGHGIYTVEISVKDEYGSCATQILEWTVTGGNPVSLDNLTGPVVLLRESPTAGPWEAAPPAQARRVIDVHSTGETQSRDTAILETVRGGVAEPLDTLKKISDSMGGRTNLLAYVVALIDAEANRERVWIPFDLPAAWSGQVDVVSGYPLAYSIDRNVLSLRGRLEENTGIEGAFPGTPLLTLPLGARPVGSDVTMAIFGTRENGDETGGGMTVTTDGDVLVSLFGLTLNVGANFPIG